MNKLFIKNMVCGRCILVVQSELEKLGFELNSVELGEVKFKNTLSEPEKIKIASHLEKFGFEILDDTTSRLIQKIKLVLIDLVQNKNNDINLNLSDYLKNELAKDYSKLSNIFSEVEGISIEKYYINLKIEKVKELIVYDELSLTEIANTLNYSSVAHLSNQFKKITGLSPSHFKKQKTILRKQLDKI